jgi:phosphoadenosine phosphosulfate reductase
VYSYKWDEATGGLLLDSAPLNFSREPRPVYYQELDILGFDKHWNYAKNDAYPYMWAEANTYWYRGRKVAQTRGGSLYTAPELVLLEDPEPEGKALRFVDIDAMVEKNRELMEQLTQDAIVKVFGIYTNYRNKVDLFHVSYSGGKDSEVTLDIVQRAIPQNDFFVIFGDTGMEFPDTYDAVNYARNRCKKMGIEFFIAQSHISPIDSWQLFGSPSKTLRWCCSVHKTTPQLLKLKEISKKPDLRELAFVGIRADESYMRSGYSYLSLGTKHKGQFSFNPILEWNSAEVYLYIYMNDLYMNQAYKKGNSRAGCLVCPMSGDKSDYMRRKCYPDAVDTFINLVSKVSARGLETKRDNERYITIGGWKARTNGQYIKTIPFNYSEKEDANTWTIEFETMRSDWRQWIKTIGQLLVNEDKYIVVKDDVHVSFSFESTDKTYRVIIHKKSDSKSLFMIKMLKQVFRKSAFCHFCKTCEADCYRGCIEMKNNTLIISDSCIQCGNCHKPDTGCLIYKSIELPKGYGTVNKKSLDSYADHAPKPEWIDSFFQLQEKFFKEHTLGSEMFNKFKRFLRDAELIEKGDRLTDLAKKIKQIGYEKPIVWAILLVNLSHTPEVNWFVTKTVPGESYTRESLMLMLQNDGVKVRGARSITGAYKRILALPFGKDVGLGFYTETRKETNYTRTTWLSPDPRVILYSLYKFAEACGDYYAFTLSRLLNHDIESDGVSPTQIFGLGREEMQGLLIGLGVNYPEFIRVTFTHDLDNINLEREKSSLDVLSLF